MSYGAKGAVRACDVHGDGYGVAVRYYRRITLFAACVVIDSIDYRTSQYADTGR
ncbi:hypothetical protein [Streptomyces sp. NPDC005423]|uniref:hypothetical protein n=1 Tax=Streptomyces sp. NPDC005423 TaxID=3155343 RepID=UPI0033AE5004